MTFEGHDNVKLLKKKFLNTVSLSTYIFIDSSEQFKDTGLQTSLLSIGALNCIGDGENKGLRKKQIAQ